MDRPRHQLRTDGRTLVVETWTTGSHNEARLLIDGREVAAGTTDEIGRVDLREPSDGVHARVSWWWTGRVLGVALVERDGRRPLLTPFEPPPGTRAARSFRRQQAHPHWYAARHVVRHLLGALVGVIGVSLAVPLVLGWIDLPSWSAPGWMRWLNPMTYLRPIIEWIGEVGPHLPSVPRWATFAIGLVAVIVIAVQEARRRRRRFDDHRRTADDEPTNVSRAGGAGRHAEATDRQPAGDTLATADDETPAAADLPVGMAGRDRAREPRPDPDGSTSARSRDATERYVDAHGRS